MCVSRNANTQSYKHGCHRCTGICPGNLRRCFMFLFVLFTLWTLTVRSAVRTSEEGQPCVIGSPRPVVATLGDDVILPCRLDPPLSAEGMVLEWSKPDLEPDPTDPLSRVDVVYLYRAGLEDTDMMMESYIGRAKLFSDQLKHGNVSLKIRSVTLEDAGRFRCYAPKLKSPAKEAVVQLVVEANPVKTGTTETPLHRRNAPTPDPRNEMAVKDGRSHIAVLISALLVLLIFGGGYFLKRKNSCSSSLRLLKDDVDPRKPPPV